MKTVVAVSLLLLLLVGVSVVRAGNGAHGVPSHPGGSVSFAKAINLQSPVLYPYSIAAGDLTHNGIPDLAVVGDETTALLHALGKGNGHFGPWTHDGGSGYAPGLVIFADLDLDGNLDALTNDYVDPEVVISFGDGHGHFPRVKALSSDVGYATNSVAVADLNGDGIPDIVGTAWVNGENWGHIFVLLGKGHREFEKPFHFGSGGYEPLAIAVADLNHDNIPDLVVVNNGKQPPYGNVSVLLGKGDGTFAEPVSYSLGKYHDPFSVALGDFNGDGNVDMAVATYHSNSVHIFLGKGDGTFWPPKSFFVNSAGAGEIVTADFNGDGILDLAVGTCSITESCHVSVLLGNGDGGFQSPVRFHVGLNPVQLVVADFTHDGKLDIATINGGDSTISILLNTTPFPTPSQCALRRGRKLGL